MIKVYAAIIAVLVAPVQVLADAAPFGSVNINYNKSDVANGAEKNGLNGRGTRLGIKGAGYLNQTIEGRYIVEVERPVFDSDDELEVRQAWLGLRGHLGEIRAGRHLSPSRVALAPIDLFTSQTADQNAVLESEVLHDKSIAYINRFNGIGYAVALSSNDGNNRISTDILANYNAEHLYLAAAYLRGDDDRYTLRFGAAYRFPQGHHLGVALETLDDSAGNAGHNAYVFNAGYKVGKVLLKAQLGGNKADAGGYAETLLGLGLDYDAWKATTLRAQYSVNKHRDHTADDEERVFSLGISYQF